MSHGPSHFCVCRPGHLHARPLVSGNPVQLKTIPLWSSSLPHRLPSSFHPSQATFTPSDAIITAINQTRTPTTTHTHTEAMANATATKKDDNGTPSHPPNGAGGAPHPATAPPLARQPAPSWMSTQIVNAFNTYVPPHVQRRHRSLPTLAEFRVLFGKYIHLPAFPIRQWLPRYTLQDASADAIGGITIGVMCIPQGLAYALLASLPPIYGLYTATLPPMIYALFGTSQHLAVGPVALVSIFYPRACAGLGLSTEGGAEEVEARAALAPVLSFWVGIIFLLCGMLRISKVIRFLSHPVMTGFTSGAAFYIGFSQLKYIFGVATPHYEYNHHMYTYLVQHGLKDGNKHTQAIGAFSFFTLYLLKVLKRDYFPPTPARKKQPLYLLFSYLVTFSTIIVVIATAYWARALHYAGHDIPVVGSIKEGWNPVRLPSFSSYPTSSVFVQAIPLTLIGFMEAFSMARKYALQYKYEIDINQEAMALGLANLLSCPLSIYPASGNFGRTALAADVGVRTPLANVVVGFVISVVLTRLTQILYYIPKATLGAVICSAVITLVEWPEFIKAFWIAPIYFVIMASTFFVTAVMDVALGLEFGLILSILVLLFQISSVERKGMGQLPGKRTYVPLESYPEAQERPGIKVYRLRGYLWFGNATKMRDQTYAFMADAAKHDKGPTHIVLDVSGSSGLDLTTMLSLQYLVTEAKKLEVTMVMAECSDKVIQNLKQCDLLESVGGEAYARQCLEDVVEHIEKEKEKRDMEGRAAMPAAMV